MVVPRGREQHVRQHDAHCGDPWRGFASMLTRNPRLACDAAE